MITVKELTKRYARNIAVDHVSFEVQRGQIVGFLGPNGAGKTTTMRMLTCFMPPSSGTATVAGFDVLEQPLEVKKHIGYLPETPPLYPEMETGEYLTYVGRLKGIAGAELRKRVDYVCERCAVADVKNKLLGKLSKGYRQRVGLAQAIVHNPDVLILDEPTAGLDPKQINETRDLIKGLAGDHTIILSTHILPEVEQTSNRSSSSTKASWSQPTRWRTCKSAPAARNRFSLRSRDGTAISIPLKSKTSFARLQASARLRCGKSGQAEQPSRSKAKKASLAETWLAL